MSQNQPDSLASTGEPTTTAVTVSTAKIWQVIAASAVGTMIEWYDFYIFGSLATIIAPLFYPPGDETFARIAYLSTFAVGFVVRPFGALFFGRIGDLVGRKYAFLVTLLIMGGATALIGFLPTYATIGIAAPIILLLIRILQGLALGGEYGGAAVYVAEHVPDKKRGFYTSFIQITATLGLFVSLAVILMVQNSMSKEAFSNWGWRVPFLISIFLVGVSLYIRLRMKESPIFQHIKGAGMTSAKRLVHGAVLCALLFTNDSQCKRHVGKLHHRHCAAFGDAVLCSVWRLL
jgi:MFS family permease